VTDELATIPPLDLGPFTWAIRRDVLPRLMEARRAHVAAGSPAIAPRAASRNAGTRAGGSIAVIPLCGVITPRGSFLSYLFGGSAGGLQAFREAFREALASPDIGAIVIDVDSPGGVIDLVPETAAEIRDARGTKPIVAIANCSADSAAYWIAAQADELVCTPSGDVGSVGVYLIHEDWSKFNEEFGVEPTYISAGRYKVDGNPDEPLSESATAYFQEKIDELYALFVEEVAAGRGVSAADVEEKFGEGRVLFAAPALAAGMIDRVATIEEVIGGLLAPGSSGSAAARGGRVALAAALKPQAGEEADDDDDEQPRCACGRWLEAGQTQCEECKNADLDDDDDEEDDEDEPTALSPEARAAMAAVLFPG
jgi:signal peptide peptidase SppA